MKTKPIFKIPGVKEIVKAQQIKELDSRLRSRLIERVIHLTIGSQ